MEYSGARWVSVERREEDVQMAAPTYLIIVRHWHGPNHVGRVSAASKVCTRRDEGLEVKHNTQTENSFT